MRRIYLFIQFFKTGLFLNGFSEKNYEREPTGKAPGVSDLLAYVDVLVVAITVNP